jgi:hypothetical protein
MRTSRKPNAGLAIYSKPEELISIKEVEVQENKEVIEDSKVIPIVELKPVEFNKKRSKRNKFYDD